MILPWPEMEQPDAAYLKLAEEVYADPEYGSPWQDQLLTRCRVSKKTLGGWLDGQRIPGPVRAMILAHAKCKKYGIDFDKVVKMSDEPKYSVDEKLKQLIECRHEGTPDFIGTAWPWQTLLADMAVEALAEIDRLRAKGDRHE